MTSDPEKIRILIIDDCPEDRQAYIRLLRQDGDREYEFVEAESGTEGLARNRTDRPDCILLDYSLPDLDGLEFLDQVAADAGDAVPPVVMLTGQGTQSVAVEAMKRGAQDYLVKSGIPFKTLERAIFNAMERVALYRRLEEGRRELEQFAGSAARELKAPLGKISHFTDFLRREYRPRLDDRAGDYLDQTHLAVGKMSQLVNGLLEYAKAGLGAGSKEPVELDRVLEEATASLRADIEEAEARIDAEALPAVFGGREDLVLLFRHLILNALRFRRQDPPRIQISSRQDGDEIQLTVSDNGMGIDAEDRGRLFAPMKRLHARHESSGLGLGLATCRKVVEMHGGRIRVESEPGEGSVFHFTLKKPVADKRPGSGNAIDAVLEQRATTGVSS